MSIRFRASSAMLLAGLILSPAVLAAEPSEKACKTDLCRSVRQSWTSVRQDDSEPAGPRRKASKDGMPQKRGRKTQRMTLPPRLEK